MSEAAKHTCLVVGRNRWARRHFPRNLLQPDGAPSGRALPSPTFVYFVPFVVPAPVIFPCIPFIPWFTPLS